MCIYIISAQFIRNNAKQSRKINPIHSFARSLSCWLHSLARCWSSCTCYSLLGATQSLLMFYAKTILFEHFVFGKFEEIIYSHSHVPLQWFAFIWSTIKLFCMFVVLGNFSVALFSEENCISFLIYQSKALITWDSLCMLCAKIMEITLEINTQIHSHPHFVPYTYICVEYIRSAYTFTNRHFDTLAHAPRKTREKKNWFTYNRIISSTVHTNTRARLFGVFRQLSAFLA